MERTYIRTCNICGETFIRDEKGRKARICSDECRAILRKQNAEKVTKRTERTCQHCGKVFTAPPCRNRVFCSYDCKYAGQSGIGTRKVRTSTFEPCPYCGKDVRRYKSRMHYKSKFCNAECYHNWDSWYKSQPEQQKKHAARMIRQSGTFTVSKIEDMVADWLDAHGVAYQRQIKLLYQTMDFQVGSAYIEVQGCYWHGCPQCFILQTPRQRKVMSRDKAKVTYCRRRNIPFYTIWEHDIRKGNFSALDLLIQSSA